MTVALGAHGGAVAAARRTVRAFCREHALPSDVADSAVLLTSELVTNAVIHGRSDVAVSVRLQGAVLCVQVADDNSRHPQWQDDDPDALDGRGLRIVDRLAARWGVTDLGLGKAVWFELAV